MLIMKKLLLLTFLLGMTAVLFAQQKPIPTEFHPCGTAPVKSEWLINYQKNPSAFNQYTRNQNTLYPAMTLHIVGTDDGTGYIDFMKLLDGFCGLNADMAQADIHFFIHGDILFIDSTAWFNHSSVLEGADMMFANNIDSTLNCYVVANPAGNAGYNLPYAGIAMTKNAAGSLNSNTWAHEVGHNLSIQHPFLGWEGNTYSYNTPTPTTVTYDYTYFKDSLITDTTIIDTAFVELVDGSNCTFAADGFCDTPPDYLAIGGWQCNAQGLSTILQKDPNGVDFRSDGTNIMTYANDACGANFTPEQIAAMRAYLQTERSPYLAINQNPTVATINATANLISPMSGAIEQFDFVELEWNAVANATHYVVQVSRLASFAFLEYNAIVTDTSVLITTLQNQRDYYWRVRPFNQGYTCTQDSTGTFQTEDLVRTQNIQSVERFGIYPTLIESGQLLTIEMTSRKNFDTQLHIFNMAGQQVYTQRLDINLGENQLSVSLPNLSIGTYIIQIQTAEGIINEKIVVY